MSMSLLQPEPYVRKTDVTPNPSKSSGWRSAPSRYLSYTSFSSTFDVACRRLPAINITAFNISITWSSTPCPRWRILQSCHWCIPIQDKGEMMAIIPPLSPNWNIIRWADHTTPLSTHHHPQPHNTNTPTITAITPFSFPSPPPISTVK